MRLTNWEIGRDLETIRGQITGSTLYPDGTNIETSRIMAAAYDGELLLIKTKNSVYECSSEDYTGVEETLLTFLRTINKDTGSSTKIINL
ncbi:MAG: hypothetical protein Q4B03_01705 [Lachnospiraceae bacterium]|nr:hypothetical protein [Lachnospiraceae bacterium]